jgi:hypothetical protein
MAQTLEDEESTVIVTVRPDVAVAVALYEAPPTTAFDGAVEVMVIAFASSVTVKLSAVDELLLIAL